MTKPIAEIESETASLRRAVADLEQFNGVPIRIARRTSINGKAYSPGMIARVPEAFGAILIDLGTASRSDTETPEEARRIDAALSERRGRCGPPSNASIQHR